MVYAEYFSVVVKMPETLCRTQYQDEGLDVCLVVSTNHTITPVCSVACSDSDHLSFILDHAYLDHCHLIHLSTLYCVDTKMEQRRIRLSIHPLI